MADSSFLFEHTFIGSSEKRVRVSAIARRCRDAAREINENMPIFVRNRTRRQKLNESRAHIRETLFPVVRKDDGKLITTHPTDNPFFLPEECVGMTSKDFQNLITHRMPIPVVYGFESIQINIHESNGIRFSQAIFEKFKEPASLK
ncbi:MAG: hypothetical protein AAB805_00265 [Patescibacteria group bacterium]